MKDLIKSKEFALGFLIGIFLFILLNIFFPTDRNCNAVYLCESYGFPFSIYLTGMEEKEAGDAIRIISWLGLAGDMLFALFISVLSGLSLSLFADIKSSLK